MLSIPSPRLICFLLIGFAALGCSPKPQHLQESEVSSGEGEYVTAAAAFTKGDFLSARELAKKELVAKPEDADLLELLGDIDAATGAIAQAIANYESAVKASKTPSRKLCDKLGRIYMIDGRPFNASEILSRAVELYPKDQAIRTDLAGLLAALGLEQQAAPHLQWLVMRGYGKANELRMLIDLSRPQVDQSICDYALKHKPEDLRPHYSLARNAAYKRNWREVATLLAPVVAKYPDFNVAQSLYLRALVEQNDAPGIENWLRTTHSGIEQEPQYWIANGIWAERDRQAKESVHAYWQASLLDPSNGEALNLLAAGLAKLGMEKDSQLISTRAGQLAKARDLVDTLKVRADNSQSTAIELAAMLEPLGRLWEAAAWLRLGAMMTNEKSPTLPDAYARVRGQLTAATPWQLAAGEIGKQLDFSDWPSLDWHRDGVAVSKASAPPSRSSIRFEDVAATVGLQHTCKIRNPAQGEAGLWIYQSGAGGAAAIDYDLDGWPDIYLTTIDGTPNKEDSGPNRLHRNLNGKFIDVTEPCQAGDKGFAQGVSVSDMNGDGFDDLFVANIGQNRIYINCGDGTFKEASNDVGLSGEGWTSSVALADFNGDGFIDLFQVGYCAGNEVLEVPCREKGKIYACLPRNFPAQKDRVWQGQADGRFKETTDQWLLNQEVAHGLGIVTGFFDEQPGMDVYVANDMSANHFWSGAKDSSRHFHFRDQASVRGLAVDRRSLSQASMGIAAGDPDLDGDIDFYLTHFTQEYNTFYEQVSQGLWVDMSSQNGHEAPTLPMLAFGTQFIDADNSGTLELIVANGHLNDYQHQGEAYRMPNQLFERSHEGMWTDLPASQIGDFFATKRLSRSLITLDFDRDGRQDSLVTHLFDPVSLLVNRSDSAFKSVALYLKSTRSHPDAIGAQVTLVLDGKSVTKQLIGGGGYQCSNQRCLLIGMGSEQAAKSVVVTWPSGLEENFGDVQAGNEYLLVEESGALFELSR
jgi:tetratricopeptide (TPR) repeat protein